MVSAAEFRAHTLIETNAVDQAFGAITPLIAPGTFQPAQQPLGTFQPTQQPLGTFQPTQQPLGTFQPTFGAGQVFGTPSAIPVFATGPAFAGTGIFGMLGAATPQLSRLQMSTAQNTLMVVTFPV